MGQRRDRKQDQGYSHGRQFNLGQSILLDSAIAKKTRQLKSDGTRVKLLFPSQQTHWIIQCEMNRACDDVQISSLRSFSIRFQILAKRTFPSKEFFLETSDDFPVKDKDML